VCVCACVKTKILPIGEPGITFWRRMTLTFDIFVFVLQKNANNLTNTI